MWDLVAAWVAAVLVFSSFFMRTMTPLRVVAISSNVAFIGYALLGLVYGVFGRVYPILVLHSSLLPLNVLRLRQQRRLSAAVQEMTDEDVLRSLVPYMSAEQRASGSVLFKQGEPADRLYLIQQGCIVFREIDKRIGAGEVFGEVGLFAPQGVRTLTAVCEEPCRLSTISRERALELYYQNPKFGFFLIRLVSGLVLEERQLAPQAAPAAKG
jgi:CRP/FNR family transcriptional regulator, cyclic AMP receptor protein